MRDERIRMEEQAREAYCWFARLTCHRGREVRVATFMSSSLKERVMGGIVAPWGSRCRRSVERGLQGDLGGFG